MPSAHIIVHGNYMYVRMHARIHRRPFLRRRFLQKSATMHDSSSRCRYNMLRIERTHARTSPPRCMLRRRGYYYCINHNIDDIQSLSLNRSVNQSINHLAAMTSARRHACERASGDRRTPRCRDGAPALHITWGDIGRQLVSKGPCRPDVAGFRSSLVSVAIIIVAQYPGTRQVSRRTGVASDKRFCPCV